MIDAEKLLDRLLGELPKPDGSPESLNAYLDAVERIVKLVKTCVEESKPPFPTIPTPPHPRQPGHPLDDVFPPDWRDYLRERHRPIVPFPRETWGSTTHDEDDGE